MRNVNVLGRLRVEVLRQREMLHICSRYRAYTRMPHTSKSNKKVEFGYASLLFVAVVVVVVVVVVVLLYDTTAAAQRAEDHTQYRSTYI